MLDINTAKELVYRHINSSYKVEGDELVILDEATIEKSYGWIFFHTSRRYLETGNTSFMLAGNAPIVVEKKDGTLTSLGTAFPVEHYLKEYEAQKQNLVLRT